MKRLSWISFGLGLWLVAVGAGLGHLTGKPAVEDITAGLFIALAAFWATQAFNETVSEAASWTVFITGAWVAIAPFALHYGAPRLAILDDVSVGLAVFVLGAVNVKLKARHA